MAKVNLPYVNSFRDRHGKVRYYFRVKGRRVALPGVPGSQVFAETYDSLLAEHAPRAIVKNMRRPQPMERTLDWVILKYKESNEWNGLKASTREIYNRRFEWLRERYGRADFASFTEEGVRRIRNKLKEHPSVADAVVDRIGMLWRFAKEHLEMKLGPNPTAEIASLHKTSEPHKAWPPELCEAFEKVQNPKLLRAYYLLRYTGQRRSDVVQMRTSRFDGTAISLIQEKTGTFVWVPAHKNLREHFAQTGIEGDYLLQNAWGKPYKATSITNMICAKCAELGFPGYSPHGLRHLAGAALAEAGATMDEIMSILGHLTEDEARGYVKQARRKVMAASAIRKWEGNG